MGPRGACHTASTSTAGRLRDGLSQLDLMGCWWDVWASSYVDSTRFGLSQAWTPCARYVCYLGIEIMYNVSESVYIMFVLIPTFSASDCFPPDSILSKIAPFNSLRRLFSHQTRKVHKLAWFDFSANKSFGLYWFLFTFAFQTGKIRNNSFRQTQFDPKPSLTWYLYM